MRTSKKQFLLAQMQRGRAAGIALVEAYVWDGAGNTERRFERALLAFSVAESDRPVEEGAQAVIVGFAVRGPDLVTMAKEYLDGLGVPELPESERERMSRINEKRYGHSSALTPEQQARAQQYLLELDQDIERRLERVQAAKRSAARQAAGPTRPEPPQPLPAQPASPAPHGGHGQLRDEDIFEDEAGP